MIPTPLQPLTNHLWQSTLFAAVAGVLTLALRKNRAQARYWLWLAASVKFLVPFSVLVMAGSHWGRQTPAAIPELRLSSVIEQVSEPFAVTGPVATITAVQPSSASLIPAIFCAAWAVGFVALVCSWCLRWRRVRAALRTASPLRLNLPFQVMSSPAFAEPGVVGIRRPVLLLPERIAGRLTPPQMEAILAHELCHVRRRDNLTAVIHMFVETVFWFHPLVWWLGARLMEERECACDEEVLRMGSEAQVYAEGILKICELYLNMHDESPLPCVAGVTGGNLKKRIEAIMKNRIVLRMTFARKAILALAGMTALAVPIAVGIMNAPSIQAQSQSPRVDPAAAPALPDAPVKPLPAPQIVAQQSAAPRVVAQQNVAQPLKFEVATVKPAPPDRKEIPDRIAGALLSQGGPGTKNPERIDYPGMTLKILLQRAYNLKPAQISGPEWLESERYDVVAKVPPGTPEEGFKLMLQGLLAERFQITSHRETRTLPVYILTVAKDGPKIKPAVEVPVSDDPQEQRAARMQTLEEGLKRPFDLIRGGTPRASFGVKGTTEQFAAALSGRADRLVRDMTQLNGVYSFHLEYVVEGAKPSPDGSIGPFIFEAVEEQLGLRLQPANEKSEVLVIDKAEKTPTSN